MRPMPLFPSRRTAIKTLLLGTAGTSVWGDPHTHEAGKPYGWTAEPICGRRVYVRGQSSNVVVLLHEINGLSPGCVDFGDALVASGFRVYMPLFFGHALQSAALLGGIESCWFGGFKCTTPGGQEDTKPVRWLSGFVEQLCAREDVKTMGVIGMCETGAFPLGAMQKDTKVKAVVVSQPALPFGKNKQRDVGISPATMKRAKESRIPILAFRFKEDTISTCERFKFLTDYFGAAQFEGHQLDAPCGFHQTWTHRLHAVLTGPFGEVRDNARRMAIGFLEDHFKKG